MLILHQGGNKTVLASDKSISFHQLLSCISFVGSKFSFPLFQTHYGGLPDNFNFISKIFATTRHKETGREVALANLGGTVIPNGYNLIILKNLQ